ncbi:MAG: LolA family protein [Janthinobacterium lividum]
MFYKTLTKMTEKMILRKFLALTMIFIMSSISPLWSTSVEMTQTQWLKKIETYMNSARTWEANFEQLNPNGSLYEGKFYLQRPGRMRLVYTYPKDQLMLADGKWLIVHDPSNDELTTLALKETPADFFLKDKIDFSEGVTVQDFDIDEGLIRVTIVRTDEPDAGNLTLTFLQSPLRLIQWTTVDANYLKTVINLKNLRVGKTYEANFFTFNRPELLK